MVTGPKPFHILLVEDDPADQKLIKSALRQAGVENSLEATFSGEEALEHLSRALNEPEAMLPDFIILDLNMPGMGGLEFLKRLKADPETAHIPAIVMTSSEAEDDIVRAYRNGANGYIKKPVELSDFEKMMQTLEDFWFVLCKLPTRLKAG
jgi:two-component system, chemotaxis family, response regulator Rcp1